MSHLAEILVFTFSKEGGYQRAMYDPGNWTSGRAGIGRLIGTNMGISAATLTAWRAKNGQEEPTTVDMQALSLAEATAIAGAEFGNAICVEQLTPGPDLMMFETVWMSGHTATWARVLQSLIGADQDGHIGPATCAALAAADPLDIVNRLDAAMRGNYAMLRDTTEVGQKSYAGWINRADARLPVAQARCNVAAAPPNV